MPASAMYAVMGANSLISSNAQANAMEAQGEYQKKVGEMNARSLSSQAEDVELRGNAAALRRQQQTLKLDASQRVAMAASGVSVESEMAQNVSDDTAAIGMADADAIRTNAWRQAWGMKSDASNSALQGEFQKMASQNTARNTMTTGVNEAAGYGLKAYVAEGDRKELKKRKANQSQGGNYEGEV